MMKVMKMTKDETNFENMKEFFLQIYIYLSIHLASFRSMNRVLNYINHPPFLPM